MQTYVEEVVQVAEVELHPVQRRIEVSFNPLDHNLEWSSLLHFHIAIVSEYAFEQTREGFGKHVPQG